MTTKFFDKFSEQKKAFDRERRAIDAERRAIDLKNEGRQAVLLSSWRGHYVAQHADLLQRAIAALKSGAKALEVVGAAPAKPELGSVEVDTYVSSVEAYHAALPVWRDARIVAGRTLAATLQALDFEANIAKREARELGLTPLGGVGLLGEHHVHGHHGVHDRRSLEQAIARLEQGYYGADDCLALSEFLAIPAPEPQSPNSTYPAGIAREPEISAALGFERVSRAELEREAAAHPRAALRGEADVIKYVATKTRGLPIMGSAPKAPAAGPPRWPAEGDTSPDLPKWDDAEVLQ